MIRRCSLLSSIILAGACLVQVSAFTMNIKKDVPSSAVSRIPSSITVRLFAVPTGGTAIASQVFASGQWSADHDFSKYKLGTTSSHVRFVFPFTNTAAVKTISPLYLEVLFDGTIFDTRKLLATDDWTINSSVNQVSTLPVSCAGLASVGATTWTKLTNVGSFTKSTASSLIELNYAGMAEVGSFAGTGVRFEVRIDDLATTEGTARGRVRVMNSTVPMVMNGIFPNLSAGSHTISVWVHSWYGTATDIYVDPGCWQTDQIVIKEYDEY